jgi:glycosyltransferase involved in cell wall biosynthesis
MAARGKVLVYTDESTAGGVAQFNHGLLCALVAGGWTTCSAQPAGDGAMQESQRERGVEQHFISYEVRLAFSRSLTDTSDPARIIEAARPDIIFFSDCSPISNVAAKHVAVTRGIPFVVMCHSGAAYLAEKFPGCLGTVRGQYGFARQVIAISGRSLEILRESFGLPSGKGIVIVNGRPDSFFEPADPAVRDRVRRELGVSGDGVLCLTPARFDSGKGHDIQLGAVRALQAAGRLGSLHFCWAGAGDLQGEVAAAVLTSGLGERVRTPGERRDVADLLDAADVFVLPTRNEGGLPLSAMEAMAKGVPVVITSVSGIPDIVGTAARLLPDPNLNPTSTCADLASALVQLEGDPALRRSLGESGRRLAREQFRQEANLRRTLEVVAAALEASRPSPLAAASGPEILVSALVSTYNSERFITGCLEDLTGQTLFAQGRMEIVVVDSSSQENEAAIVADFKKRHSNIVFVRTAERETLYAAWNRAVSVSRGRFLSNANTDDRHRTNAMELMALALEAEPGADLVYGDCYLSTIPNERFSENGGKRVYAYPEFFAPASLLHYQFGPQPMWRRSVHSVIGGFDGSMRAAGDYDFNIRFARKCVARHLPIVLGSYLAHAGAISFAGSAMQQETAQVAARHQNDKTIEELYARAGVAAVDAEGRARVHLDLGLRALNFYPPWAEGRAEGNAALAARCFITSLELNPRSTQALNNLICLLALTGRAGEAEATLKALPAAASDRVIRANMKRIRHPGFAKARPGLVFAPSGLDLPGQQELAAGSLQQAPLAS